MILLIILIFIMRPHLKENDEIMFYKYLDKANVYFEFGSGGSTYQASIRNNIKSIYSVESDIEWYNKIKNMIPTCNIIYNEMNCKQNTWGTPGVNSTKEQWINYSNQIVKLDKSISNTIDFILIDGRFRVACCLKCYNVINDDCLIAFDDFLSRPKYKIILDYYDIINKTSDDNMVILKKKKHLFISDKLIKIYELIKS